MKMVEDIRGVSNFCQIIIQNSTISFAGKSRNEIYLESFRQNEN